MSYFTKSASVRQKTLNILQQLNANPTAGGATLGGVLGGGAGAIRGLSQDDASIGSVLGNTAAGAGIGAGLGAGAGRAVKGYRNIANELRDFGNINLSKTNRVDMPLPPRVATPAAPADPTAHVVSAAPKAPVASVKAAPDPTAAARAESRAVRAQQRTPAATEATNLPPMTHNPVTTPSSMDDIFNHVVPAQASKQPVGDFLGKAFDGGASLPNAAGAPGIAVRSLDDIAATVLPSSAKVTPVGLVPPRNEASPELVKAFLGQKPSIGNSPRMKPPKVKGNVNQSSTLDDFYNSIM
jgi:hypothetical protein